MRFQIPYAQEKFEDYTCSLCIIKTYDILNTQPCISENKFFFAIQQILLSMKSSNIVTTLLHA